MSEWGRRNTEKTRAEEIQRKQRGCDLTCVDITQHPGKSFAKATDGRRLSASLPTLAGDKEEREP